MILNHLILFKNDIKSQFIISQIFIEHLVLKYFIILIFYYTKQQVFNEKRKTFNNTMIISLKCNLCVKNIYYLIFLVKLYLY